MLKKLQIKFLKINENTTTQTKCFSLWCRYFGSLELLRVLPNLFAFSVLNSTPNNTTNNHGNNLKYILKLKYV